MRKPQGYAVITSPDGVREADTTTCAHCQHVTHIKAFARAEDIGGWCRLCAKPVCAKCAGGDCDPFLKKIEREEARYHSLRSMGLA